MEITDYKIGDKVEPNENSPLFGSLTHRGDTYEVTGINDPHLEVTRNGWHKIQSLPCYFDKLKFVQPL